MLTVYWNAWRLRHGWRADDPGRDLHVLFLHRLHHVLRGQIADASFSGSSQMRIEYSRAPKTLMSPTPSSRASSSRT